MNDNETKETVTQETGEAVKDQRKKAVKKAAAPKTARKGAPQGAYAVVQVGGRQLMVTAGQKIKVDQVQGEPGTAYTISEVLMLGDSTSTQGACIVGTPSVQGAAVKTKIIAHEKDKKIIIYKKKRRTGYTKSQGHRQTRTTLLVEEIVASR